MKNEAEWRKFKKRIDKEKQYSKNLTENEDLGTVSELERKKDELKEKRNLYKPIDHKEIDEFQK